MTKYAAFLRGIGPGNPNMHGVKLRSVLEDLGYSNVKSVISSGNVLFEARTTAAAKLEAKIETAWPEKLGFASTTFVRSQQQLQKLLDKKPFGNMQHSQNKYLIITFLKTRPKTLPTLPIKPDEFSTVLSFDTESNALCSVINLTKAKTPQLMLWLERQFGKQITTRTLKTVQRVVDRLKP